MVFLKGSYFQENLVKISATNETGRSLEFEECEFNSCSFIDCKFVKCKFIKCKFSECNLSVFNFVDSRLTETAFSKCKVIGLDWTTAAHVKDLDFNNSQIDYSNFRTLKLPKISIVNCEAKEVDFTEADLNEGIFTNTDFERSVFFKTNLAKANFVGAKNYYIDVRNNFLHKTHFSSPEVMSLLDSLDIIID